MFIIILWKMYNILCIHNTYGLNNEKYSSLYTFEPPPPIGRGYGQQFNTLNLDNPIIQTYLGW